MTPRAKVLVPMCGQIGFVVKMHHWHRIIFSIMLTELSFRALLINTPIEPDKFMNYSWYSGDCLSMLASCYNEQLIWKKRTSVFATDTLSSQLCKNTLTIFFPLQLNQFMHFIWFMSGETHYRSKLFKIHWELCTFSMIYWQSKLIFLHCIDKVGSVFS